MVSKIHNAFEKFKVCVWELEMCFSIETTLEIIRFPDQNTNSYWIINIAKSYYSGNTSKFQVQRIAGHTAQQEKYLFPFGNGSSKANISQHMEIIFGAYLSSS